MSGGATEGAPLWPGSGCPAAAPAPPPPMPPPATRGSVRRRIFGRTGLRPSEFLGRATTDGSERHFGPEKIMEVLFCFKKRYEYL